MSQRSGLKILQKNGKNHHQVCARHLWQRFANSLHAPTFQRLVSCMRLGCCILLVSCLFVVSCVFVASVVSFVWVSLFCLSLRSLCLSLDSHLLRPAHTENTNHRTSKRLALRQTIHQIKTRNTRLSTQPGCPRSCQRDRGKTWHLRLQRDRGDVCRTKQPLACLPPC